MPQLRQNILTGEWVVIAPERSKRPSDFIEAHVVKEDHNAKDPFALEGDIYKNQRIAGFETDNIYLFRNNFPAFVENPEQTSVRTHRIEGNFYSLRPSTGGHDVVVIKPAEHNIYGFSKQIWYELFSVSKKRFQYWHKEIGAEHSMLIYNHGAKAGASVVHPHAQIFTSNIIPNQVVKEMQGAERYFLNNGVNVFDELIRHEKKEGSRMLLENDEFIAFTFYAARFPFEAWVIAKEGGAHFENEPEGFLHSLADIMQRLMKMYGTVLKDPALNFYIHDLPRSMIEAEYFRWHIEITPRLGTYGGYELGSGVIIDVMSPEDAAGYLRDK